MNKNNDCSKSREKGTKGFLHQSHHCRQSLRPYYHEPAVSQNLFGLWVRTDGAVQALGCDNDAYAHRLCAHLFGTSAPTRKTLRPRDDGGEKARAWATPQWLMPPNICVRMISQCKNTTFILQLGCKPTLYIILWFLFWNTKRPVKTKPWKHGPLVFTGRINTYR